MRRLSKTKIISFSFYLVYLFLAFYEGSALFALVPLLPVYIIWEPKKLTQTALVPYEVRKLLPENLETFYSILSWVILVSPVLMMLVYAFVTPGFLFLIRKLGSF